MLLIPKAVYAQYMSHLKKNGVASDQHQTYVKWSRHFQRFLKNKPPLDLSTEDVKAYLTFLAVQCKVAASTQNQAFNSLLFFYRHGLKREFGELRMCLVPRSRCMFRWCCHDRRLMQSLPSSPTRLIW